MILRLRARCASAPLRMHGAYLLALALLAAGCFRVDLGIPASMPEKRYDTPRAVSAAIPRDQALAKLADTFARCRMPNGARLHATVGPERFQWAWRFVLPMSPVEKHEFDFAYAETTPKIIDLSSLGGRLGVKFTKNGEDVPYAYLMTVTQEDAEAILDCFAVLGKRSA